jgi:hypothetical protein
LADAPPPDSTAAHRNVIVCTDGCAGQYKGRFNFKYLAAYAKRFGVTVMQAFSATAHGKGFHDALGQKPGLLMKDAELYDGRRIEFAYDLFLLCREKLPETVPASQRGKGLHAVHKYFVNYVTSDHRDIHLGEPSVIYIDRRRKWETDGIPGSATKYFSCGADQRLRLCMETDAGNVSVETRESGWKPRPTSIRGELSSPPGNCPP